MSKHNETLQLTAQSAAALWVPSTAFGRSGGNRAWALGATGRMGEKFPPEQMKLYRLTDEILHYLWDPVGVAGIAEARDEYYAYLPEVFGLLLAAKKESEIAAYLTRVESQCMGGTPDNTSNIKIAGMLIDAREALIDHGS